METSRTERQRMFISIAAAHAEDFKTRVTQHDRENSFPHENVAAMKASGYTSITAPEELGGGGADILDLVMAQERLGTGDLPTAISINMHLFAVGWLADLWHLGERKDGRLADLLESVVRERLVLAGGLSDPKISSAVGFGGLNETSRRAEKVAGGYIVNGVAKFGTLSACADLLFETAHYDDPVRGALILGFYIPTNTPGIKLQKNWDTMSIRASSSNDIVWENVFVPDASVRARPVRSWDASMNVFSSWMPSLDACYVGLARAASDYAINWTRDRTQVPFDRPSSHYPANQFLAAEMEVGVRAAHAMLIQTAAALADRGARANPPMMDIIACHHFVPETALGVVDKAMRLVGGAGLFRTGPLEQMFRDARAGIIHQPFAGYDGLAWLGKLAFGIPYDTMPRWV